MDHGGQLEREGPVVSRCEENPMCDNQPGPLALAGPNLNLKETRAFVPEHGHRVSQAGDTGACEPPREDEDAVPPGSRDHGDDAEDELMKEEEDDESEESGLIRCQSPDTPMTDSSFSETGSLLETHFGPGTSPEAPFPLNAGAAPEASYPLLGSVEPSQWDQDVDACGSNTGSGDAAGGFGPQVSPSTAGPTCTTGPVGSSRGTCTSTPGPASTPPPQCIIAGAAATAKTDAVNSLTGSTTSQPVHPPTGPTCSNASTVGPNAELVAAPHTEGGTSAEARGAELSAGRIGSTTETPKPGPPLTEPFSSEAAPDASADVAPCAAWPASSTPGPTCVSAPTSGTGPTPPRPALLACLEQLERRGDDAHLPQHLHQIAEAFVKQEDYQRALWCLQLERLYHQRLLDNLSALQKQWESSCRSALTSDPEARLDALTHICQTHHRPAASDALCASLELLKATMTHDEKPPGELTSCTSGHLTKGETEAGQRDTEPRLSGKMQPFMSSTGRDHADGKRLTAGGESAATRNGQEGAALHTAPPIIIAGSGIPPAACREMDRSKPAESQGVEGEATQEKEAREEEEQEEQQQQQQQEEEERETWESREDAHAPEMEVKGGGGEEQGEEEEEEGGEAVPEEPELSGIEEVVPLLQQEGVAEDNQWEVTQLCLHSQPWEKEGAQPQQEVNRKQDEHADEQDYGPGIIKEACHLDDQAKLITVEEVMPACGLVSILKKRGECVPVCSGPVKTPAKRRVRFKVADDVYDQEVGGGDSCLLLFLLCLVTVVISIGGTALYCALGDAHSTVCQDFSRNADFYVGQMQRGITHLQHWLAPGS